MKKISVMISSTVNDLREEREAIKQIFNGISFVELIGADPYDTATVSGSSFHHTINMARNCDLYVLVLGERFGFDVNGKSATELEFDAAYKADPTKVLVLLKNNITTTDKKQKDFIDRVCDYYSGYWRVSFSYAHELQQILLNSFFDWLKERVSLGDYYTYFDHFVRLAIQKKPEPSSSVFYSVKESYVELEYRIFNRILVVHLEKEQIYKDFWRCLYDLEEQIKNAFQT